MGLGIGEILLVSIIGLLVFGPRKIPQLARSIGHAVSEFRKAMRGIQDRFDEGSCAEHPPTPETESAREKASDHPRP